MIFLLAVVGFLFFAGVAMAINEGLWNNTVLLLCILISSLVAAVAGAPLGVTIMERAGQTNENAWYCVFGGMWVVFILTMLILRVLADKASRTRVRFLPVVDKIGGILMGLAVAVMLASFAAYTLVRVPIIAGEWEFSEDSSSQRSAFAYAQNPFRTVVKNFVKAEEVDSPFYGK
jgi:hypothetical protein